MTQDKKTNPAIKSKTDGSENQETPCIPSPVSSCPTKGKDMSSTSKEFSGKKARGDTAEGKDDPNTENDGDNGPGAD